MQSRKVIQSRQGKEIIGQPQKLRIGTPVGMSLLEWCNFESLFHVESNRVLAVGRVVNGGHKDAKFCAKRRTYALGVHHKVSPQVVKHYSVLGAVKFCKTVPDHLKRLGVENAAIWRAHGNHGSVIDHCVHEQYISNNRLNARQSIQLLQPNKSFKALKTACKIFLFLERLFWTYVRKFGSLGCLERRVPSFSILSILCRVKSR